MSEKDLHWLYNKATVLYGKYPADLPRKQLVCYRREISEAIVGQWIEAEWLKKS